MSINDNPSNAPRIMSKRPEIGNKLTVPILWWGTGGTISGTAKIFKRET
jgi:cysteine synthase